MNIIIYNINSFGGNYEYSKYILTAYQHNKAVAKCSMLAPANADVEGTDIHKILLPDISKYTIKIFKKLHFLYRSIINPFRLRSYLQQQPSSIVLFNDFDQLTALFWPHFFKSLQPKHHFAVMLHDPDRDLFFKIKWLSEKTMKNIMSVMNVAFYHGFLPEKSYYQDSSLKVKVPHGIYYNEAMNTAFLTRLKSLAGEDCLIGILGNIRDEKNYELIIDALAKLKNVKLLIAGKAANSSVSVEAYKEYAEKKNVQEKTIWLVQYLNQADFNAAIEACDVIMLYYKASFTSQSGVLNTIAPFRKKLIISDIQSSLTETVKKYNLGKVVPDNDPEALIQTIADLCSSDGSEKYGWKAYMDDVSWDKHVAIAVDNYKKLIHEA